MILPTVHLNGTSRSQLLEPAYAAIDALREAIAKVRETYPNGRDYYPQGDTVIYAAQEEYIQRIRAIENVLRDMQKLVEHLEA